MSEGTLDAHNMTSPKRVRRRRLVAVAGLAIGSILLAACSSGSGSDNATVSPTGSSAQPQKGGTLRLTMSDGSASDTLDPTEPLSTNAVVLMTSVYDQLVTSGKDYSAVPALATSWESSADGKIWTIKLRTDVKWQDGTPFTSKDVVFTMKRWTDPKLGGAMLGLVAPFMSADGVAAPDASTVVVTLPKAMGTFMQTIAALPYAAIVKDGTTEFTKNVVGTGPFKLADYKPGQGWKLVRNDSYWGGQVYLDEVDGTLAPDQSSKVQSLLAGSTDLTDLIPTSLWPTLQGKDSAVLTTIKNKQAWVFAFNQTEKPFNDPKVIQALKIGTNRDQILQTALQGAGTVINDIPLDPTTNWYPSDIKPEYDPQKAKSLLAEAGFPNGLDISLSVTDSVPGMVDTAQAWQQGIKDAGVNVTLNQFPADTYYTKGWMATPAFMDYWNNFYPPVGLTAFYTAKAPYLLNAVSDPKVDALTDEVFASTDPAKQLDLTQRAYEQSRNTYGLVIPVFANSGYANSPKVHDVVWDLTAAFNFRKAWLSP